MDIDNKPQMILAPLLFLAELFFWFSVGLLTHRLVQDMWPKAAIWLAVGASLVTIVLWAFFVSPQASYRLPLVSRLIVVTSVMTVVAILFISKGEIWYGVILLAAAYLVFIPGQIVVHGA